MGFDTIEINLVDTSDDGDNSIITFATRLLHHDSGNES